jgi:hypothetical protein
MLPPSGFLLIADCPINALITFTFMALVRQGTHLLWERATLAITPFITNMW